MNSLLQQQDSDRRSHAIKVYVAVAITLALVLAALFLGDKLSLLLIAGFVAVSGLTVFRWPDLTTLIGIGLLYSNLPVVAVRFHGLPGIVPAAALGIFAWPFVYRVWFCKERVLLLSASPYVLLFAAVQLVGVMISRDPKLAFSNFVSFLSEGVILYFLVSNLIRTRRLAVASFWTLALCAILMGGVPLAKQLSGFDEADFGGLAQADSAFRTGEDALAGVSTQQRSAGTIGEKNRYAQFMIMLAPIAFCLVSISKTQTLRLLAVVATLMALVGFALAFSRGAAVGLGIAFVLGIGLGLISRNQLKWVLVGFAFVLLLLPQYLTRLASLGDVVTAVGQNQGGFGQTDGAVRGRVTEMGAAVLAFRDHSLVGVGPGMFRYYSQEYGQIIGLRSLAEGRQAHSMPLDIAAEHGVLGLLAFGAVLWFVIRSLLRARKTAIDNDDALGISLTTGMLLAVLLYLSTGLFLHLSYIRYFWLLIALADAIGHVVARGDCGKDSLPQFS